MLKSYWRHFKTYWKLVEPSKWLLGCCFVGSVLCNGCTIARPLVASLIIGALVNQDAEATYFCILAYALVAAGYRVTEYATWRLYSLEAGRDYLRVHDKVFGRLAKIDGNFVRETKKGKFMNTVNGDITNISEIGTYALELIITIVQIPVILIIVGSYNVLFAILIAVSMAIYFVISNRADKNFNRLWHKKRGEDDNYSNLVGQVIDGLQEVKTFNMLPRLHKKLDVIQHRYDKYYKDERRWATIWMNDVKYFYYGLQTLLYVLLVVFFMNGWVELGVVVMIAAYHETIVRSYGKDIMNRIDSVRLEFISLKRIEDILNYRVGEEFKFGRTSLEDLQGKVELKNVSLKIGQKKILSNVSLKIKPHETVAIVGMPGAGKTMLFDLLLRLEQPTKGRITLDDIDINEFSREIYTSSVAVANQAPFVFNISIRDNLDFVNTNIKAQIEACKTVGIHEFIEALPQGYNTILRENASNVSGGQRQMISIARTILTDAEVLLFDDITTSLDPDTAVFIPKLVQKLKKDHTVILITKKPDLMAAADRIVVMNQGKIEMVGTHKTLLQKSGIYRALQVGSSSLIEKGKSYV